MHDLLVKNDSSTNNIIKALKRVERLNPYKNISKTNITCPCSMQKRNSSQFECKKMRSEACTASDWHLDEINLVHCKWQTC